MAAILGDRLRPLRQGDQKAVMAPGAAVGIAAHRPVDAAASLGVVATQGRPGVERRCAETLPPDFAGYAARRHAAAEIEMYDIGGARGDQPGIVDDQTVRNRESARGPASTHITKT